jgi:hypothetical protein
MQSRIGELLWGIVWSEQDEYFASAAGGAQSVESGRLKAF